MGAPRRQKPLPWTLSDSEVHVWSVPLAVDPRRIDTLSMFLSATEHERAKSAMPRVREQFVVGRAAQRFLLTGYTGAHHAELRYVVGEFGKPALAHGVEWRAPEFSVANAEGLALIAVARWPVGVDLECIHPYPDAVQIAERFFAPAESGEIQRLNGTARDLAFLRCWTRKEAYVKARGYGLSFALNQFTVDPVEDERPRRVRAAHPNADSVDWVVRGIRCEPGYVAALAYPYAAARVVQRTIAADWIDQFVG